MPTRHPRTSPWAEESSRLREAFEESGYSRQKLAGLAGVTPATVSDMLDGKRAPRDGSLLAVCAVLRLNPSWVKMGREPRHLKPGEEIEVATARPGSAADLQSVQLPGVERWIAESRGISPDEREWLRTVQWPHGHIRYPDLVYSIMLNTYRQMRDYKPFEEAHQSPTNPRHA